MKTIQSFILFYILIGFLLQILGDFKLNRYIRFYGGLIFVLLLMSPIYELITKEDVSLNVELKQLWQEYEESRNYEQMMENMEESCAGQATKVLTEHMEDYLNEKGYEIIDYDVIKDEEYEIVTLRLYVVPLGKPVITAGMTNDSKLAVQLKEMLVKTYEPEFFLEVYCNE